MSSVYKPMRGWGTGAGDGPPVLNYNSDNPVVMLSPCPYAQFEIDPGEYEPSTDCTVSVPASRTLRLTLNTGETLDNKFAGFSYAGVVCKMMYEGMAQYNVELSWHTTDAVVIFARADLYAFCPGGGSLNSSWTPWGGANWGTITVPYYRWRFNISLEIDRDYVEPDTLDGRWKAGDWVQATLVPVVS